MNTIEKVQYADEVKNKLALGYALGLDKYPVAEKIASARLGTMHTITYKSINKDVPGLIVYKKIRMRLTNYAAQKCVQEAWASGLLKKSNSVDNRIHFKNNLAYNLGTKKYTFSFVPYEKLQEKFVLNGWEISGKVARHMIEASGKYREKKVSLTPWRTVCLDSIVAFK